MLCAIISVVLTSCTLIKPIASIPSLPQGIDATHHVSHALPIDVTDNDLGKFGDIYHEADERLIILDSQNTCRLGNWVSDKEMGPTREALMVLCSDPKNKVRINSGLPTDLTKDYYAGIPNLEIYGEYGSTKLNADGKAVPAYDHQTWIPVDEVGEKIENFIQNHCKALGKGDRREMPGYHFFRNKNTLLFGYLKSSTDRGQTYHDYQIEKLALGLKSHIEGIYHAKLGIKVTHSLERGVIEFLPPSADKGVLAEHLIDTELGQGSKSLALSFGDGPPDESMHQVMNRKGHYSVVVLRLPRESDQTYGRFSLRNVHDVLALFRRLAPQE